MRWTLFLLAFGLLAWGCSAPGKIVVYPPAETSHGTAPIRGPAQEAGARAEIVEGLLKKGMLPEEDRASLSGLASAYRATGELASNAAPGPGSDKAIQTLLRALDQVQEAIVSRKGARTPEPASILGLRQAKEREILDAFAAGDHRGVISRCEAFRDLFGPQGFTPELTAVFAGSLAREQRLPEAILVAGAVLRDMEARPSALSLGVDLARWQLQSGEGERAVRTYQRALEKHEEQGALLRSLGEKIAMKDVPATPRIPLTGKTGSDKRPEPGESRVGTSAEKDPERQKALVDARRLMDEERYQEALSVLDPLASAGSAGGDREAVELREKAVEGLIERDRNRAARLFLAARQATDPDQKDQYLRASFDILQALVEKYPTSPLIAKVRAHRDRVREEMERR